MKRIRARTDWRDLSLRVIIRKQFPALLPLVADSDSIRLYQGEGDYKACLRLKSQFEFCEKLKQSAVYPHNTLDLPWRRVASGDVILLYSQKENLCWLVTPGNDVEGFMRHWGDQSREAPVIIRLLIGPDPVLRRAMHVTVISPEKFAELPAELETATEASSVGIMNWEVRECYRRGTGEAPVFGSYEGAREFVRRNKGRYFKISETARPVTQPGN